MNRKLLKIFIGRKGGHLFFFSFLIFFNVFAALLEGISFGMILFALSTLDHQKKGDFSSFSFFGFDKYLETLSQQEIFVFFVICAIGFQVLRSVVTYFAQFLAVLLSTKIQSETQKCVYAQILRFNFECVSKYKVGDLVHYANTPTTMVMPFLDALNKATVSLFTIFSLLFFMVKISFSLTTIVLSLFVLFGVAQRKIFHKIAGFSKGFSETTTNFNKHIVQNLHGIRPIHLFNRQNDVIEEIKNLIKKTALATKKLNLWHFSMIPINEIIGISLVGTCLILGPYFLKVSQDPLIPSLLTFITVTYRLSTRIQIFISGIGSVAFCSGSIFRLNEILKDEDKQFVSYRGEPFKEFKNEIELENVCLQYQKGHPFSLKNISCSFPKGSFTALVGPSGAGKSSLIDLLLRLYEPSSGEIRVGGKRLEEYEIKSWRKNIGVVTQDTFIFNETIEENIRFGFFQASYDEVILAAKTAGAHEFIEKMPEGYQSVVGERGYRLSGGEKQRIAMARVLLRKPEVLILDEATSNLDSHSELLIQQAIEKLQHQKTIIAIAHRLSTIVKADKIFVLEEGRIVERGFHQELLQKNGKYSQFWKIQSANKDDYISNAELEIEKPFSVF